MGFLDFLFGKNKKQQQAEAAEKKRAEDERRRLEAERQKAEKDKQLMEQLLRERTVQLKRIEEQMAAQAEENKKAYSQMQEMMHQQPQQPAQDPEEAKKIEELEKKLKEKEQELKKQQLKQTMELYAKQSKIEEELHKKKAEAEELIEKLKVEGGGEKTAEMLKMEEELKKREEELKKKEEEISSKELDGWIQSIDNLEEGEATPEMIAKKEELEEKEREIAELEKKLQEEMGKIDEYRQMRRNEFRARLGNLTFDNFVVGPSNRFPFEVCQSIAKTPAEAYNPLYLYGSVGLGKTHLLSAIGNYIMANNPEAIVIYVSSETFTNELIHAVEEAKLDEFRDKYRNVDVLLIDDIQFIGKQETTQEEFFHTFNALYNSDRQIIIASDRPPKDIPTLEARLRSRFEGGLITDVKPPDKNTRILILKNKAQKEKMMIPAPVISFLAEHIKSNIRTLIGALNKVMAYANLAQKEMNVEMVNEVLADILEEEKALEEGQTHQANPPAEEGDQ